MNRLLHSFLATLIAVLMLLVSCAKDTPPEPEKQHTAAVTELISLMDANPSVKALLEKSISQAASINPDRRYNPAQSLDEFYEFVDWNIRQLDQYEDLYDHYYDMIYDVYPEKVADYIIDLELEYYRSREDLDRTIHEEE